MTFTVLVTGSRNWGEELGPELLKRDVPEETNMIRDRLNFLYVVHGSDLVVMHGACPTGADIIAHQWCQAVALADLPRVEEKQYPAKWEEFGKRAGPIRNRQMVDLKPDLVIAFIKGESRGTRGTVRMAKEAGLTVEEYYA